MHGSIYVCTIPLRQLFGLHLTYVTLTPLHYTAIRHGSGGLLPAPSSGSDSPVPTAGTAQGDSAKVIDVVADRRRAKALKVCTLPYVLHNGA
jgi:hypothetical protein